MWCPSPTQRIEIEDLVCEDDRVAVRYRLECRQVRPHLGAGPRAGQAEDERDEDLTRSGGKIAESAGHDDVLGLPRQLGVVQVDP